MLCYRNDDQSRSEVPKKEAPPGAADVDGPAMHVTLSLFEGQGFNRESEMAALRRGTGGCVLNLEFPTMVRQPSASAHHPTMRLNAGCVAVLFTLVHAFGAKATKSHTHEYDFHVSNLQRDGVRRTVVNGQLLSSDFPRLFNGIMGASRIRPIPRWEHCRR